MIFDALLALDLPATLGPPLPTPALDGLERWLFTGRWLRRVSTCTLSAGAVLARSLTALRTLGPWTLTLQDDAAVTLALPLASPDWGVAPASWPERLPARWTTEPCDFQLQATRIAEHCATAITVRHQPRHADEAGALVAAVRVAWSVPQDPDPGSAEARLGATLGSEAALGRLRDGLARHGEQTLDALAAALAEAFPGAVPASHHDVRVLHGIADDPNAFSDRLAGLGSDATGLLPGITARVLLSGRPWSALDARGVPGRIDGGRFHPNTLTQVTHAL